MENQKINRRETSPGSCPRKKWLGTVEEYSNKIEVNSEY